MNCVDCNKPKKIVCRERCNNCYKKFNRDKRPKIPCACGCGIMIPPISRDGKPNKFVWRHNFGKLEKNQNWNGGQFITTNGYRMLYLPNHPYADKQGYYQEHRDIVEKYLTKLNGIRTLLHPSIEVHHINEDKLDNRIENLMALTHSEHRSLHKKDLSDRKCFECGTNETGIGADGYPVWFKWKDNSFCCRKCYTRNKRRLKNRGWF